MRFIVHMEGRTFEDGASIEEALLILSNYSVGFGISLKEAARGLSTTEFTIPQPTLKLVRASQGSLDVVTTAVDTLASLAPVAVPAIYHAGDVVRNGWKIYKAASELISTVTKFFKRNGHPMQITVDRSPGAQFFNITGDNNVIVTPQVLDAAKAIHKNFDRMALPVKERKADLISVHPEDIDDTRIPISITRENSDDFHLPERLISDPEQIEIECRIYRLNMKNRTGYLDYHEDDVPRSIHFEIVAGNLSDYVDALKSESTTVIASRDYIENVLGERNIKRLFLHGITNR